LPPGVGEREPGVTYLRALVFNLAFYLWTALYGLVGLPVLLLPRRQIMAFGTGWSKGCLKLAEWIVGLSWEIRGREHLPKGAAIIAMKHQSAWDTLVLPAAFKDAAIVVKRELLLIPVYGWFAGSAGAIGIDRKAGATALRRMIASAERAAAEGRPIAIFPEGTRVAVGARRPYHPGVAALYKQLGLPLVPVAVNSGLFWGRRAFLKRPGRIIVEILPPIPPGLDRRAALAELERRIETATDALVAATSPSAPLAGTLQNVRAKAAPPPPPPLRGRVGEGGAGR
jgi:1-acyl-sn-glycerol-3-phosphate acyltransferase